MQNKWIYSLTIVTIISFLAFYLYNRFKVAPDIKLKELTVIDLHDQVVDVSSYTGKKVIICFAASWCGPCREELKMIGALKASKLMDVTVLVISDEPEEKVFAFKDQFDFPFVWLRLPAGFSSIGINSIPTSYLVNTKGAVVKKTVGFVDWNDPATSHRLLNLMD
ncbi:MAG: TlpA disulfide reductase family protein [bacterium]|nr:TlpA disulfide reductase family protein [bacterium]